MIVAATSRELVRHALLDRGFKLGAGVDARGRPLAWSLDCRELTLDGSLLQAIADVLWPLLEPYMPALIAGPTVSAAPLVSALLLLAAREGKASGGALVRPSAKAYGLRKTVEGPAFPTGQRAVIVDDVLARGSSVARTCHALRRAGAVPLAVLTLVDLEVPSAITIDDLAYASVFRASELGLAPPLPTTRSPLNSAFRELPMTAPPPGPAPVPAAMTDTALVVVSEAAGMVIGDRSAGWSNMTYDAYATHDALCVAVWGAEAVTVSRGGRVTAFHLVARNVSWMWQLDSPVLAAAVNASGDHVIVASTRDCESLDLTRLLPDADGSKAQRTIKTRGTPIEVISSGGSLIVATTRAVYNFRPDLTLQWGRRWTVQSNVVASPEQDAMYLIADNTLLALNLADGATRWERPILGRKSSQIAAADDSIIVASEITVAAFGADGSAKWLRSVAARITAGPAPVGCGLMAVVDRNGGLHLLRTNDGTIVSSSTVRGRLFTNILADAELLVMIDRPAGIWCVPVCDLLKPDQ